MPQTSRQIITTILGDTYRVGLAIKGLDGLLELVGGLLLLAVPGATIHGLVEDLTTNELSQDPHDFIANGLIYLDHKLLMGGVQLFVALYLIGYGAVKMGLAVALLKRLTGAYRPAIVILSIFLLYQIYQIGYTHSRWLLALSTLDAIVLVLVIWEYRRQRQIAPL